eukprot:TRINITY_DN5364_c0_g2_i14.p1 TRINITY_DN5364_c0_g2~~TRINITY_DN5364_c0_g2_i14.p1  ORF type:complete len:130 (-),score=32.76 TRINITY_DN5364_c0_g2_i14:62-451(-)
MKLEMGPRGRGVRPAKIGPRAQTTKRVVRRDKLEFLSTISSLLATLTGILKKEHVDPSSLVCFFEDSTPRVVEDDNVNLLRIQEVLSHHGVGEQFKKLEKTYGVTLEDCKRSTDENVVAALRSTKEILK